ncbi:flagella synthesis protein FlgN [Neptunomonas japonica]|uniref:flagella synthesis protein FlgN n=1 Tax=Neptunomonas japonica TaxID=417574 RepID=UPI000427F35E|nr:flagellar protein FlgN [Neptunomonas japonica]
MTDFSSTLASIDALALEGITILSGLEKLLDQELAALKAREIETIQTINTEKQTILRQFDQNNQTRAELLIAAGLPVSKEGLSSLLSQNQNQALAQQFKAHWSDLETVLKSTMNANQRNEQIVMRSSQSLDKLLTALRGQKPSNSLYTSKGAKGNYTGQSHIGKA